MIDNLYALRHKILSPQLILDKKLKTLNKKEILEIDQNYKLSFFLELKERLNYH